MSCWWLKCDRCGRFMGETNPPVESGEYPKFDPRQEQWYPEEYMYCKKCSEEREVTEKEGED